MTLTTGTEALFTRPLQPSEHPTPRQVDAAICASQRAHHGARGCAAACAAEYGDRPESAAPRMRWALAELDAFFPAYAAA